MADLKAVTVIIFSKIKHFDAFIRGFGLWLPLVADSDRASEGHTSVHLLGQGSGT